MTTAKKTPPPGKPVAANDDSRGLALAPNRPDWVDPHSHQGSEDITANDITLPRIEVLQALSPQLKKNEAVYIEGSEQGQIFNTISGEIYGDHVVVVPILFQRQFILWQDRKLGGGFAGSFTTEVDAELERDSKEKPDDYEVAEHHINYCLVLHENGNMEEAVLSWARTKLKASRRLNALVQMNPGDRFSRAYRLRSVEASSPKGDYWTFDISPMGYVPKDIFDRAAAIYAAIKGGERKVDYGVNEGDEPAHDDAKV
jgi:hypothetical protein